MAWVERQRHIVDFMLSSLWRRRGKNVTLFLAYSLVIFVLASVAFAARALKQEAAIILKGAPEIVVQRTVAGRHNLIPLSYEERIREIRGVAGVEARLWGYYYDPVVKANYTVMVAEASQVTEGSVAIGEAISREAAVQAGDLMSFRTHDGQTLPLRIRQVFSASSGLVSADLMLVSPKDYRRLFGVLPDQATDLAVSVPNEREVVTVARKIATRLPDTRPILRDEILRTYDAVFSWRSAILIILFLGAVLAFIIFAWDRASGLSAEEKREIGILKAIGWETSDVMVMKTWEGAAVSLSAFLTGTLLAYAHVFLGQPWLILPVLKGWSTLYPEFRLTPFVSGEQIVILLFLTVLPYTMATVIPAWRAATVDPDLVMREVG